MFRTMQTSSAACALYAAGAPAGAVAWPWRPWASGAPKSALQVREVGWSPACRPPPRARDCPCLAVGSSQCWPGWGGSGRGCPSPELLMGTCTEGSQFRGLHGGVRACEKPGDLAPVSHSTRLSPLTTAWGPAAAPVCSTTLVQEWPGWTWTGAVAKLQTQLTPASPSPPRAPGPTKEPVGAALHRRGSSSLRSHSFSLCLGSQRLPAVRSEVSVACADCSALTLLFLFPRGGAGAGSNRGCPRAAALAVRRGAAQP